MNPTSIPEDAGWCYPSPHSVGWGSGVVMSCGVGGRWGLDLDPLLLWLWWGLAWELPYAAEIKQTNKLPYAARNEWTNKQTNKQIGLGRVGYGLRGAAFNLPFFLIPGLLLKLQNWLSCFVASKEDVITVDVSEPGRGAWHLRKQAEPAFCLPALPPTSLSRTSFSCCPARPVTAEEALKPLTPSSPFTD